MEAFNSCYDDHEYGQLVDKQELEGYAMGLRGTPSFQINDTVLAGPPSYDQWVGLVNEILANQP